MRASRPSTSANTSVAGRSASSSGVRQAPQVALGSAAERPPPAWHDALVRSSSSTLRRNASTSSPPPASAPPRGRTDADFPAWADAGGGACNAAMPPLRYALTQVVDRTNAHAELRRPASAAWAQHQLIDRLVSEVFAGSMACLLQHSAGQLPLATMPGRLDGSQALHRLRGGHRRWEV